MKAEDLSCVHMFPCDLGEMSEKETYRIAYSLDESNKILAMKRATEHQQKKRNGEVTDNLDYL